MRFRNWGKVREIFEAVDGLSPEEKASYIAEVCSGDEILHHEVNALLSADLGRVSFLETYVFDAPKFLAETGQRIGEYCVASELGRGGMGIVYLATDGIGRQVAIKILGNSGAAGDEMERRFQQEIQILSKLDHPSIAKFHGTTGRTDEGYLYFVMEYVEGISVTRFCEENDLSIPQRLRLFQKICRAISYAHQNLIVHRDLKPSNILVTPDGEPKLLDFGIAKLLASHNPEPPTILPDGSKFLTPDYASPEQILGLPITTVSDVYSLGIILFELLAGQRPYYFGQCSGAELRQRISEVAITPPSEAFRAAQDDSLSLERHATVRSRRRQLELLRGDLDNIVLVAVRKEPKRRYNSAKELSDDIERHIQGFPVIARADTWSYRTMKFLQRNKLAAASVAALIVFSLLFGISMAVQQARLERERDRAEEVLGLMIEIFELNDPSEARGRTITGLEILQEGTNRVRAKLTADPATRASLLYAIGRIYLNLGSYTEAERNLNEALHIRKTFLPKDQDGIAKYLNTLAEIAVARAEFTQAEKLLRDTLTIRQKLHSSPHPDVAVTLNNLAWVLHNQERNSEAESLVREALRQEKIYSGNEPAFLNTLAWICMETGRFSEAEELFRKALHRRIEAFGPDHPRVGIGLKNLAAVLDLQGKVDESEAARNRALQLYRKVYGPDHPELASILNDLSLRNSERGNYSLAESQQREALRIYHLHLPPDSSRIGISLGNLAKVLRQQKRLSEAEEIQRRALSIIEKSYGNRHKYFTYVLCDLASILRDQKRYAEAETLYHQAIRIGKEEHLQSDPFFASNFLNLSALYAEQGHHEKALGAVIEALAVFRATLPQAHWRIYNAESYQGRYLGLLDREGAESLLLSSYTRLRAIRGSKDLYTQQALERLITFYEGSGRQPDALKYRAEQP
ncbi:MAG TPA: tetratricopeptide repeat protein [Thermoanaerobaculia bacterium]|nr:tetratricopeptide repeat protein [Thermoanaerobaculia bacterium]